MFKKSPCAISYWRKTRRIFVKTDLRAIREYRTKKTEPRYYHLNSVLLFASGTVYPPSRPRLVFPQKGY